MDASIERMVAGRVAEALAEAEAAMRDELQALRAEVTLSRARLDAVADRVERCGLCHGAGRPCPYRAQPTVCSAAHPS